MYAIDIKDVTHYTVFMKQCTKCKIDKELSEFRYRKYGKFNVTSVCKICESAYRRERYKNSERVSEVNRLNRELRRHISMSFVKEYAETIGCKDCGESDFIVLEFDDVKGRKFKAITALVGD